VNGYHTAKYEIRIFHDPYPPYPSLFDLLFTSLSIFPDLVRKFVPCQNHQGRQISVQAKARRLLQWPMAIPWPKKCPESWNPVDHGRPTGEESGENDDQPWNEVHQYTDVVSDKVT